MGANSSHALLGFVIICVCVCVCLWLTGTLHYAPSDVACLPPPSPEISAFFSLKKTVLLYQIGWWPLNSYNSSSSFFSFLLFSFLSFFPFSLFTESRYVCSCIHLVGFDFPSLFFFVLSFFKCWFCFFCLLEECCAGAAYSVKLTVFSLCALE